MKFKRRHRTVLLALGIYWPFLFWLTHIPVPALAPQSGMSDKTMHVIAYFVLTFLVWFGVNPYEKVNWYRIKPWIVLGIICLYGAIDEYVQGLEIIGRSADIQDFIANLFGIVLALGLLSVLSFWTSLLTISAVFIFVLSDMSRLMTLPQYASYATAFHFTAYTAFSLVWIQWLGRHSRFKTGQAGWFAASLALPAGLLLAVKVAAPLWDHPFNGFDTAIAGFGITAAVLTSWMLFKFSKIHHS
jgi:VanZ family protein